LTVQGLIVLGFRCNYSRHPFYIPALIDEGAFVFLNFMFKNAEQQIYRYKRYEAHGDIRARRINKICL